MTILQIILTFTHFALMAVGYKMGKEDGYKQGRYAARIGGQR